MSQAAYSVLEEVPVPVLAAVQGACVGAGVDLITAADMRFASADAWFCVKVGSQSLALPPPHPPARAPPSMIPTAAVSIASNGGS
jgi:hypothetical protein